MPLTVFHEKDNIGAGFPDDGDIFYSLAQGFTTKGQVSLAEASPDHSVNRWKYSSDSGEVAFNRTELRPGFEVWVTNALVNREMVCLAKDNAIDLAFGFCLSGNTVSRFNSTNKELEIHQGCQGIFYSTHNRGVSRIFPGEPLQQVFISLKSNQVHRIFSDDRQPLPLIVKHALERSPGAGNFQLGCTTPAMLNALQQIINCRLSGLARKLFLESRALELIVHQLEGFGGVEFGHTRPLDIHPEDRRRTEYAHDLLVRNIAKPPHLEDITKAVGMSHPKLNRCFKQLFGCTVFEYLRNERLRRASALLEEPGVTITEVAYTMGYSSPSHFTRAYKKQFGSLPSINSARI